MTGHGGRIQACIIDVQGDSREHRTAHRSRHCPVSRETSVLYESFIVGPDPREGNEPLMVAHPRVAFPAVDGPAASRLERHRRALTTMRANGGKELPICARSSMPFGRRTTRYPRLPPDHATTLASHRFVKTAFSIEPLFPRRERELPATITANKKPILFKHALATPR